jgi:hypothetical protein
MIVFFLFGSHWKYELLVEHKRDELSEVLADDEGLGGGVAGGAGFGDVDVAEEGFELGVEEIVCVRETRSENLGNEGATDTKKC